MGQLSGFPLYSMDLSPALLTVLLSRAVIRCTYLLDDLRCSPDIFTAWRTGLV
jgi:hypothetical protein